MANWQSLVAGVKPGVDVVVLDPAQDGISQVTAALKGLSGVRNLEFLANGASGTMELGSDSLDLAALTARAGEISGWSASLAQGADIVFWSCDVAQGSAGSAFVADMHTLTGATVGAADHAVGSATEGGSWNLDVTTGALERDSTPFTVAAMAGYTGVLDGLNATPPHGYRRHGAHRGRSQHRRGAFVVPGRR